MNRLTNPIRILFVLSFFVSCQTLLFTQRMNNSNPYEALWKEVAELQKKQRPESVEKKVQEIYDLARKDNNEPQRLKAVYVLATANRNYQEDGEAKYIARLEKELESLSGTSKAIMLSMTANAYYQYLNQYRWQIQQRTQTTTPSADVATWSVSDLYKKASELHLEAAAATANEPLAKWEPVVQPGSNSEGRMTSVHDLLVFRALQYFGQPAQGVINPEYVFKANQEWLFEPAAVFASSTLVTKDNENHLYRAIGLYQQALRQHQNDTDKTAWLDIDLHRLKFAYEHATHPDKETRYRKALENWIAGSNNNPISTEGMFSLAQAYQNQGGLYDANAPDKSHKDDYKKAVELCRDAIKKHPKSYGAYQCQQLLNSLGQRYVNVNLEEVSIPGEPMLVSIDYKNLNNLHWRIVPVDWPIYHSKESDDHSKFMKWLCSLKPASKNHSGAQKLIDPGDFRDHRTEMALPVLNPGQYVIMVSRSGKFSEKDGDVSYTPFQVSNLALLSRRIFNGTHQILVADRNTGKPVEGAQVKVTFFDYRNRNNPETRQLTTDKDGFATLLEAGSNRNFSLAATHQGQTLYNLQNLYHYYMPGRQEERTVQWTEFFMDRAIYRPGQTAYFKGIVMQRSGNKTPEILPNTTLTVYLKDVNGQLVKEVELRTNAFGSVSGQFILPEGGLTGNMHLESSISGSKYFSVEEYKRPTFEVVFDPVSGEAGVGDQVTTTGTVKAFAGNNLDGTQIQYTVTRETRLPWLPWWMWRRGGWPGSNGETQQLASGETTTDANGAFKIDFIAQPDESIDKNQLPMFVYTIRVEATDVSGETRTATKTITLDEVGFTLNLGAPEKADKNQPIPVTLSLANTENKKVDQPVQVKVYELASPQTAFRKRYWEKPDQPLMNEKEFKNLFPQYAYAGEDEVQSWAKKQTVYTWEGEAKDFTLDASKWSLGHYLLEVSAKSKNGKPVSKQADFFLYDEQAGKLPAHIDQVIVVPSKPQEPGQTLSVLLLQQKPGWVYVEAESRRGQIRQDWEQTTAQGTRITIPIVEDDRGGMQLQTLQLLHNRYASNTHYINVPWSNKDLNIEFITWRDKLQPGAKEEWSLKISGAKKEAVQAEVLATMYDASLDFFAVNTWQLKPFPGLQAENTVFQGYGFTNTQTSLYFERDGGGLKWVQFLYPSLVDEQSSTVPLAYSTSVSVRGGAARSKSARGGNEPEAALMKSMAMSEEADDASAPPPPPAPGGNPEAYADSAEGNADLSTIVPRTDLAETVFFYPQLETDAAGNLILRFTMKEALTRWKLMLLAHTTALETGVSQQEVVTQKELMVQPNAPRFLREGDELVFSTRVSNLTSGNLQGTASLQLLNALNGQDVTSAFGIDPKTTAFQVSASGNTPLFWTIKVPDGATYPITYRVLASAGQHTDGEESTLPVLTNKVLVTESMPLYVNRRDTRTFDLERLDKIMASSTAKVQQVSLEFTSNPAWYAVKALPYLMEYPYECTEQIFSRYYANTLASSVANSQPKIKEVFEQWKNTPEALASNLQKNQALKSALLEETPWVMQAQSEAQQRQQIALLFDLHRMQKEQNAALQILRERQMENGAFAWFPGGRESWYITQHLVAGLAHLNALGATDPQQGGLQIANKSLPFIDGEVKRTYEELAKQVKAGKAKWQDDHLNSLLIHYLYTRSFFPKNATDEKIMDYYLGQAANYWQNKGLLEQGMIAIALHRYNRGTAAKDIVVSLKERAVKNKELGMYWKQNPGYFWYQAPVETQALMIEVFHEVAKDEDAVEELKLWLLKNKQTTHWKTTKATSEAVYALLKTGSDWLTESKPVEISFPKAAKNAYTDAIAAAQSSAEAGSGYFQKTWQAQELQKGISSIRVKNPNKSTAWGAAYWQYLEHFDKVTTFEETPLTLRKEVFKSTRSDKGNKLVPIKDGQLKPGDKLVVRIELRVDRDMEYVHMKDYRGSGLEPENVFSTYKWQDGLGYYESTRDVSTNFFFDYLPRGTYVFEYPLRVVHTGNYSNGITSIQCMYAPEFTSHSAGERLQVNK